MTVNVLGRNITATIANMRLVDWESLGINFVMVFSPNAFAGAPHSNLATLTYPGGGTPSQEAATIRAVAEAFPMVTAVRVKEALEAIGSIVANLVLGHPRRQRRHACCCRAGARRRARRRPSPSGLRRGDPQDAWRHPAPPDFGLWDRVPADRLGHGAFRSARRLARRLVDRRAAYASAALPGCPGRRWRRRVSQSWLPSSSGWRAPTWRWARNRAPVLRNL